MTLRLFGIPLRVKLSFLIVICLLSMPLVRHDAAEPLTLIGRLGTWVVVVVLSVIVHELGHAFLARRFGATVSMELWALGGLTSWQPGARPITPPRRIAIAAAGSGLGFLVGGAAFPLWRLLEQGYSFISLALGWAVWVNLGWGLINWLPIRLLDGGHIFRGLIEMLWPKRAKIICNLFFLCSSGAAALVAYRLDLLIASLFAIAMLVMEVRRLLPNSGGVPPPVQPPSSGRFLLETPPGSRTRN